MTTPIIDHHYTEFLHDLKNKVALSRSKAALSVNRELILLYHHIGTAILKAQKQQGWGRKLLISLAMICVLNLQK
jgi:hypothetical protein